MLNNELHASANKKTNAILKLKEKQSNFASASPARTNAASGSAKAPAAKLTTPRSTVPAQTDARYTPSDEEQAQIALVGRLPDDFPVEQWDKLSTKSQLAAMRYSGLTEQEQWTLLNASAPLHTLSTLGKVQSRLESGSLNASEADELTDRAIRLATLQQRRTSGDASILPPLQKRVLDRQLEKEQEALRSVLEIGVSGEGDGTLYDWDEDKDKAQAQPFPFPAPVPVLKDVPYPPNGEKAYVFYTNGKEARFKKQAEYQKKVLESYGYDVELVQTDNVDIFTTEWDKMDPKTTTAVIISHCNGMSLIFEEGSKTNAISATGFNTDTDSIAAISGLKGPEIAALYIYACNAGHEELLASAGTNVADAFRDLSNVDTVYAFDGSVGFGPPVPFPSTFEPRLSNKQNYDQVFTRLKIPAEYGKSGVSGFLEYKSDD